jgi:DNA processing protein
MTAPLDDEHLAAAVLAGLGSLSRARLASVLDRHRPTDALERLVAGAAMHRSVGLSSEVHARLVAQARAAEPADLARRLGADGIAVMLRDGPGYPGVLAADAEAPAVLFGRGRPEALGDRRVAIVGTRNATAAGRATATELGRGLADSGVTVVSGLALGIDAAAHDGAVAAGTAGGGTVAVVGNGLDEAYPRRNVDLFERLCAEHLVLSEWPPGTAPEAFRFPLRNRIIAALAEVLVVVESRERGGSLITARAALDRGVDVMVVPGSPRTRAAAGTNELLRDGAAPVTCVGDVLDVLSISTRPASPATAPCEGLDPVASAVLDRCRQGPATLDALVAACAAPIAGVVGAVAGLLAAGHLTEEGGWVEATASRFRNGPDLSGPGAP